MDSPGWLTHLIGILSKIQGHPALAIATVDFESGMPIPRVRNHEHRNILTSNPVRPLIITTTDIRSAKIRQIRSHPKLQGLTAEATWWFPSAMAQFRLTVRTHIVPSPSHELHSGFLAQLLSVAKDGKLSPDPQTPEEWEKFRVSTFNSIPSFLRASFVRPAPGSVLSNPNDATKWPKELPASDEETSDEERMLVREALKNFAVLALEPLEVDVVEFTDPNRRTKWWLSGNSWQSQAVVP